MSYIHSPQFNHHGTRLYPLFRRASSTGHYDSTWIQYFPDEQKNHPFAMLCELHGLVVHGVHLTSNAFQENECWKLISPQIAHLDH
uniref:Uncharacterized protein n=1 Tax=Caenorhabditis japonica TaxID=281687 RepID=A0A8R1IH68_CAEJA